MQILFCHCVQYGAGQTASKMNDSRISRNLAPAPSVRPIKGDQHAYLNTTELNLQLNVRQHTLPQSIHLHQTSSCVT
jgi:hypothetical protein